MSNFASLTTQLCSILLPQLFESHIKDTKSCEKVINLSVLLTTIACNALACLKEDRLKEFDALVGETSCQLRAFKIVAIANGKNEKRLSSLIQSLEKIRSRLLEIKYQDVKNTKVSLLLESLGEKESGLLNEDELFLILSYLLFITKDKSKYEKTKTNNLKDLVLSIIKGVPPKDSMEEIVRQAKFQLADRSISFLQSISSNDQVAKVLCSEANLLADDRLKCSPCFINMQVLMQKHIENSGHILLCIERKLDEKTKLSEKPIKLLFGVEDNKYVPVEMSSKERAVVFIKGQSISMDHKECSQKDYISKLLKYDLSTIILANAALHPQYAGKNRFSTIPLFEKQEDSKILKVKDHFEKMQDLAKSKGFCLENPALFCINHILVSTLQEELKDD